MIGPTAITPPSLRQAPHKVHKRIQVLGDVLDQITVAHPTHLCRLQSPALILSLVSSKQREVGGERERERELVS